jgi:hypothetical protein
VKNTVAIGEDETVTGQRDAALRLAAATPRDAQAG